MTDTTYVDGTIPAVSAAWLNDVNAQTYKAWINVKMPLYGAKGDNSTTDTAAIQAALTAAAVSGGRVYVPTGTYICGALTVGSNVEIVGDGPNLTVFKIKNGTNDSLFKVSAKSFVAFRNFKVSGNSANQTQGNGILVSGASTDVVCENVLVDDHYDWGFNFTQGTRIRCTGCGATNGRAGANANSVRAGFLFGTSGGTTAATDVEATNCYASSPNAFVDGFMCDYGSEHRLVSCRTAVAYTGFKIRADNVIVSSCYATGGFNGYQTQAGSHNLVFKGNIAYRTNESGFFFNNTDTVNPLVGLIVEGNIAVECGQSPSSTSYGFAFEGTAAATVDQILLIGNIAIDNQVVKTQVRGISFGASGTFSNVVISGNFTKGNTADNVMGTSLQTSTTTFGFNPGFSGSSYAGSYPTSVQRLQFWTDNLPQSSGTVTLSDGFSGRGYQIPRAGYIRSMAVKSNAPITAGNVTFQLSVNGVINSNFNTVLNTTNPTFLLTNQNIQTVANILAAGDMITVTCVGDASLLPNGSADFDVVVEVVY